MNVNTWRIVSITVLTLQAKNYPDKFFDIIVQNSKNIRLEQDKIE